MAKEIKKVIDIDVSQAERNVENLNKQIKDLKSSVSELNAENTKLSSGMKEKQKTTQETTEQEKKQAQTVKELRKEINDLRDSLVPLTKGSEEWNKITDDLVQKQRQLTNVTQASKEQMTAAAGSYNALQNEMTSLRREWKETTDEATRAELGNRIKEINDQLKEMDATIGNHQRNVGNYENAIRAVTAEYTSQRSELKALRVALEELEPGTEMYNKAFNRAAEITHNLAYQQEMLKYSSADLGDQLSNMRGIASGLASGYGAVNAAMGLFGSQSEDVQKAMLKVQQAMALVQGLQGLDGFIKRTQGLSTAMKVWFTQSKKNTTQTLAQGAAATATAAATAAQAAATEGAAVAQEGLNVAMKANPVGLVITALAVLLPLFEKWFGLITKVTKAIGKLINPTKQAAKEMKKLSEDYIKDSEARLGADWKYSEEGREYYKKYYDSLLVMYKKDKEKFKEAQREKWSYERELREHDEQLRKEEEQRIKDEQQKRVEAAKTYADKMKEIDENYSRVSQNLLRDTYNQYREDLSALMEYFEKESKRFGFANEFKQFKEENKEVLNSVLSDYELFVLETESVLGEGVTDVRESVKKRMLSEMESLNRVFQTQFEYLVKYGEEDRKTQTNDTIIRLFKNGIRPTIEEQIDKLNRDLQGKKAKLDFEIETGLDFDEFSRGNYTFVDKRSKELEKLKVVYEDTFQSIETELKHYQNIIDYALNTDPQLLPSEEVEAAKKRVEELNNALTSLNADYYINQSTLREKYFNEDMNAIRNQTRQRLREEEVKYTASLDFMDFFTGDMREKEDRLVDEQYNIRKQGLERQEELYKQMLNEQTLTAEQRVKIEAELDSTLQALYEEDLLYFQETQRRKVELIDDFYRKFKGSVDAIGDLFGSLSDFYEADINAKVEMGEMTEEQAKKEFEKVKGYRIAEAITSTIGGSVSAMMESIKAFGMPAGPIIGAVAAAATLAAGMAQVAKIKSTGFNGNSVGSSISAPSIATYEPQYVQNTTGAQDADNLRNAMYEQPLRAYVVESDITNSQSRSRTRQVESSF